MNAARTGVPEAAGQQPSFWRQLATLLHPYRGRLLLSALAVLFAQSIELVPALLIRRIVDHQLTAGRSDQLFLLGALYLGALALAQLVTFVANYSMAVVAQGALHALRVRLVDHLHRLPLQYYDRTPLGDVISRSTADVEAVDTLFSLGIANLLGHVVRLATATTAMVALSPPLALLALLAAPPLLMITRLFQVRVRDAERRNRRALGALTTHLQETLGGVEVIRVFGREHVFVARFRQALRATLAAFNQATLYTASYLPIMAMLAATATGILLWSGAGGTFAALGVSIGTLTAFVLLFGRFFEPITTLGNDWQTVQSALSGVERLFEVLAIPPEQRVAEAATFGAADPVPGIEVHNVVFGYQPDRPIVRGVSWKVARGEHVALIGRTGAGKSSALNLMSGLYAPWSGSVRVAGRDPRLLPDDERRWIVGVVPQTVQLFTGTIAENLTLGDQSVSRATLEAAAQIAGADTFIQTLPHGYDTPLSGTGRGDGVQLSAGQRQLLALARALVWNPTVLLLDEATDAIDSASDAHFRAALRTDVQIHGRTVLTVAHRLSTARDADRVIVVEMGRVVEAGPPDDLLRRGGRFAMLVALEEAGWNWEAA